MFVHCLSLIGIVWGNKLELHVKKLKLLWELRILPFYVDTWLFVKISSYQWLSQGWVVAGDRPSEFQLWIQICAVKLSKFIPATCIFRAFLCPKMRPWLWPRPYWEASSTSPDPLTIEEGACYPSPSPLLNNLISGLDFWLRVTSGHQPLDRVHLECLRRSYTGT